MAERTIDAQRVSATVPRDTVQVRLRGACAGGIWPQAPRLAPARPLTSAHSPPPRRLPHAALCAAAGERPAVRPGLPPAEERAHARHQRLTCRGSSSSCWTDWVAPSLANPAAGLCLSRRGAKGHCQRRVASVRGRRRLCKEQRIAYSASSTPKICKPIGCAVCFRAGRRRPRESS